MKPEEERVAFYMEVGLALTEWAKVEDAFRAILAGAFPVDSLNRRALNVAYFALEGFRAKLNFTNAFVKGCLADKPQHHGDWNALVERAHRDSSQRNKLAHWTVTVYDKSRPGRRYALEAWVHTKKALAAAKDRPKSGALCIRDIVKLRFEFEALTAALTNFLDRLGNKPGRFPESAEQPSNPPTIVKLRREILDAFRRP